LVAIAEDWAGNEVASTPIVIGFGDVELPEMPELPDTETGSESDESSDSDGASACSCMTSTTSPRGHGPLALFAAVCGGFMLRRRNCSIAR
jgi:hypothetical protein